jgi:hypothetical protein
LWCNFVGSKFKICIEIEGVFVSVRIVADELMPNGFPKIPSWMPNVFDSWVNSKIACTWMTEDHQSWFDLKSYLPIRLLI